MCYIHRVRCIRSNTIINVKTEKRDSSSLFYLNHFSYSSPYLERALSYESEKGIIGTPHGILDHFTDGGNTQDPDIINPKDTKPMTQ